MIRQRVRAWFENRLPRSDSQTLTQRKLYILPTQAGWGFGLTLALMLLASVNYQLNLGYALTFLLGGAALVAMHQTHANLCRLELHVKAPAPVFAGHPATIEVVLDNPGPERHGVGMGLYGARRPDMTFCDVPAQGSSPLRLRFTPQARGRHALPTLLVETHFPLGLFRAWTVWRPAARVLVYPAPEQPPQPLPPPQPSGSGAQPTRRGSCSGGGGEFEGVRAYRRGDAMRQVAWKKMARSGEMVSRDTSASAALTLLLDAAAAGNVSGEARLSRLAAWVLAAEQQGLDFGLKLPGLDLPPAGGQAQRRAALEALALWPTPDQAGAAADPARRRA